MKLAPIRIAWHFDGQLAAHYWLQRLECAITLQSRHLLVAVKGDPLY